MLIEIEEFDKMDDTVKVEEPMVEEPVKEKKGKGLILGIIGVLIAALVGIGVYLFLVGPKTNVYLTLLDKYSNSLLVSLDKVDLNEKKELDYEVSLNITGDSDIKEKMNESDLEEEFSDDQKLKEKQSTENSTKNQTKENSLNVPKKEEKKIKEESSDSDDSSEENKKKEKEK